MRVAHVIPLTLFASLIVACEDGPNQTFNPLPNGGAKAINNGNSNPSYDPATASLDASFPGKSLQEICSADEKKARWAEMLRQPVAPPRKYAGIDMAKSDNWEGLTVEEAEHINCQALNAGSCDGDDNGSTWGDNGEVEFCYNIGTHLAYQMVLNRGYTGTMKFHSRQGGLYEADGKQHTYEMGVDKMLRDNVDFQLDWTNGDKLDAAITELFDGAMATFAPSAAIADPTAEDQKNCDVSAACLVTLDNDGVTGIFGFRPLAIYFETKAIGTPQPIPSHPFLMYNFYVKNEPYSNLPVTLKIDKDGPLATGLVGPKGADNLPTGPTCNLKLGITYGDFLATCLNVSGNPDTDKINVAKFVGGRTHTLEDFSFNIVGVNQNFTHVQGDFDYITDDELPSNDSVATNWTFDVRAKGNATNDKADIPGKPGAGTTDLHGTGLVFAEYAKLVQAEINKDLTALGIPTHALGAAECFGDSPAKGCTGFETFMYPNKGAAPAGTPAQLAKLYSPALGLGGAYDRSYLKPGDPQAVFCTDPANQGGCTSDHLWDYSFHYVVNTLGHGDIFGVPTEARDRRFYFRLYTFALMSYMKAVGIYGNTPTLQQVDDTLRNRIDLDSIFFDNNFLNQFDKAEYVERDFMDATHPLPMDFEYGTDIKVGNQRYANWFSKLEREEKSLYVTMQTNKSDLPGKENNLQVTNLFGSPLIAAQYISAGTDADGKPGKSAWACATRADATGKPLPAATAAAMDAVCNDVNGGVMTPPTDAAGNPLLDSKGRAYFWLYKGAFPDTPSIYHYGSKTLTVEEENINAGAAKISLPNYADPYDQTSQSTAYEALVPWFPKRAVTGFNLPLSGTRDKFIQTAQLDFSGITTTILIDYDYVRDDAGKQTNVGKVLAIETQDFLGKAFLCSSGGDYLTAEMYTSVGTILDWIDTHPGSQDACGLIVRYSPFNNYPDFVSSLTNGVRASVSQGAGFGRIVDVVLFDPALAQ